MCPVSAPLSPGRTLQKPQILPDSPKYPAGSASYHRPVDRVSIRARIWCIHINHRRLEPREVTTPRALARMHARGIATLGTVAPTDPMPGASVVLTEPRVRGSGSRIS